MNQILLLMQGVREPVATYERWRSIGRQVLKGSKAAEIVRPITVTRKNDDGEVESTSPGSSRCVACSPIARQRARSYRPWRRQAGI